MKHSLLFGLSLSVVVATLIVAVKTNAVSSALAVITCTTTAACTGGNNTGTGPGVLGESRASHGVIGETLFNSTSTSNGESAVIGEDLSTSGVYDMGVQGTSTRGYGVRGKSSSNVGVRGDTTTSFGVEGTSTGTSAAGVVGTSSGSDSTGVAGSSSTYIGVDASGGQDGVFSSGNVWGVVADGNSGGGVDAFTTSGTGVLAQSTNGIALKAVSGNYVGVDASGPVYGGEFASNDYPLVLFGTGGSTVFYVSAAGNVYYHGTLNHFASPTGVVTSDTQATSPALEETGTARLVMGTANVYLTSSFSRSINPRYGYQVFLTPGGDTRGLYVTGKYTGGFTVREVQGGRGTFSFDYHVYAQTAPAASAATTGVPSSHTVQMQPFPKPPQIAAPTRP